MKKLLIPFCVLAMVMTACKKEPSYENPDNNPGGGGTGGGGTGGGGSTNSGLLSRVVLADAGGSDSSVTTYQYDAAKRLIQADYNASGTTEQIRFVRNSAGIITQTVTKNPDISSSLGVDSLLTRYNYSTSESRYKSSVFILSVQGITYADSTVFNYNTNGTMSSKVMYIAASGVSAPVEKMEFTYTGGNVSSIKAYTYNTSTWDLEYTFNLSYDAKVNPLQLGVDALLLDPYASTSFGLNSSMYFGPNNATVIEYVDGTDPSNNFKVTSAFTYNASNKPADGTATESSSSGSYKWRFYYY